MKTTKEMLEELNKIYPHIELLEEYKGANVKIGLRCNKCGHIWKAVPRSVASSKHGCPKCGVAEAKYNKAKALFLSRLDSEKFELIEYKNYQDVTVKCKVCGYIRNTTSNNILRYGCKHCSSVKANEPNKLTLDEFIQRAKEIHGDKYDYSKVNYVNWHTPVIIICPKHGEFEQSAGKHLQGQGCPKCIGRNVTREEFITWSTKVHNGYYTYDNLIWNGMKKDVIITCPIHGNFRQNPYVHLKIKCGCPKCKQSHGERETSNCLDQLNISYCFQKPITNPYKEKKTFIVDFYFELNNTKYIIEYNGKQHYEAIELFGGEDRLILQQIRDNDLRRYCKENNIQLLEISYKVKFENILDLIKKFIAVPIEESLELQSGNIGETPEMDNTEINSEIKESESSYSVEVETQD